MSAAKLRLLKGFTQSVLPLSLCAFAFLQGCGVLESKQQPSTELGASHNANERGVPVANEYTEAAADAIDGTWQRSCVPDGAQSEEKLILNDGTFIREFVTYENNCSVKKDTFTTSGTFVLGDAALNTQELVYVNGNFTLKPASVKGFRNIDFTIEAWTFSMSSDLSGQDDADIAALKAECQALEVRKEKTTVVIQRNGCTLKNLPHHNYEIASVQDDRLTTGIYINDLNSFDPAGGTTPELRHNVMNNTHMTRVGPQ
ncbi:MAG: hypothetical protein RLZZ488_2424 [Pseudomonadota bacterium]|jgi:hypothetical protein